MDVRAAAFRHLKIHMGSGDSRSSRAAGPVEAAPAEVANGAAESGRLRRPPVSGTGGTLPVPHGPFARFIPQSRARVPVRNPGSRKSRIPGTLDRRPLEGSRRDVTGTAGFSGR